MAQARPDRIVYRDRPLATLDEMIITTADSSKSVMLILIFQLDNSGHLFQNTNQIYPDLKVNFLENPRINF